jgi:hypothetical protein
LGETYLHRWIFTSIFFPSQEVVLTKWSASPAAVLELAKLGHVEELLGILTVGIW